MLKGDEIEILDLEPTKEERQEVKKEAEVQNKSKIVPFFVVGVSILIITQIVTFVIIVINNI